MVAKVSQDSHQRRSSCPVSCSLDIFGDKWTLLVIRDLFFGRSRFKELLVSPEGVPTNLLSERLKRLLRYDIIKQMPSADGSKHLSYQLTKKGQALRPILEAMRYWGLEWEPGTEALMESTHNQKSKKSATAPRR
jgi:DNA-binding HxlR family transcriptional regulator